MQSLLESRRPDPGPVVGRWALGIGDMVADHPLTPDKLRGLARKLNHFGGVAISEEGVEFDGDEVKWSDITEIRTRSLIEYLFTGGIDKQADKLPLPWFPVPQEGDRRDLAGGADAAARGGQATTRGRRDGDPDTRRGALPRHVAHPRTVTGHARRGDVGRSGGSSVFRGDRAGARHHDRPAEDDVMEDADERAEQIKSMLDGISARIRPLSDTKRAEIA